MERKTIEEVVVGMDCSVGGVGWSERGTVVAVTSDTFTMEPVRFDQDGNPLRRDSNQTLPDLDTFSVDRAGIKWVFSH